MFGNTKKLFFKRRQNGTKRMINEEIIKSSYWKQNLSHFSEFSGKTKHTGRITVKKALLEMVTSMAIVCS